MASQVQRLKKLGMLNPGAPAWIADNCMYEVMMGSVAYGVSNDMSDQDIYGWCIPPKNIVFPHQEEGRIEGFGRQIKRFDNYQQHHIKDASTGREYDIDIYNIVRYFMLCMENNPNMIDSLFVPQRCILHMTPVAQMVRDRRREFLHKGAFHKLKGYAFSQLSKMDVAKQDVPEVHELWTFEDKHKLMRTNTIDDVRSEIEARKSTVGMRSKTFYGLEDTDLQDYLRLYEMLFQKNKRLDGIKRFGYDVKYAYHVVRLASEAEQILVDGDLDLEEPGRRDHMKAIRRGDVTQEDLKAWFTEKERSLERLYIESKLRHDPDEARIKQLLLDCLEHHYGSLAATVRLPDRDRQMMEDVAAVVDRWRMGQKGTD